MELNELAERLDEEGIGDPGVVEILDLEIPDFREDLRHEEADDASMVFIVATASLFREPVAAFEVLARMRGVVEKQSTEGWKKFYSDQQTVWRERKDKSQHDLQYLRIVLGMKQSPPRDDEPSFDTVAEPDPS